MRILHVNKYLYRRGGAESYMMDVAALQQTRGDDVEFFGMDHPDNPPGLTFADWFPDLIELEPAPAGLVPKMRAGARMIWSTSSRRGIDAVLEAFRPDIAHLHNVYHQLSPSIVAALRDRGVPTVMTLHDYKLACPSYQLLAGGQVCEACLDGGFHQAARRRCKDGSLAASSLLAVETSLHRRFGAYDGVAALVCPSRFLSGIMARAGIAPERLHVVRHFVDLAGITVKDDVGGPVVFAGRLSAEKGVDVLIRAIGRSVPGVGLVVAGEGPERAALEALARTEAPDRVRFAGRLGRADVLALMRSSLAVAVPSRWYENQPMTVLEAFACGVPVLGSRLGGLIELVDDGVTGALVPHDDPDSLAAAIDALAAHPEAAAAMGRAGRRWVLDEFTPERHLDALAAVYAAAGVGSTVS